ncbi:lipase family protein [Streptomyces xanthochromogenes]|uniref:lipase family protein n=1 Tax=Streptomyces TaxID=1883 RepID=UPI00136EEC8F|nr:MULTISPECIES: lipase family protein [Streptomyces]MYV94196.1 lipase [Streptomyces sp. SID1034]GHB23291.1 lipase [Streptomyces xanthochromogenes]
MHVRTRVAGAITAALLLSAATPTAFADDTATASPGDIVSQSPTEFHPLPGQWTNTRAWHVTYRSTTAKGTPNTVSGTVIVPNDGRTGPRPVVTYAVGTVGLGDSCAPSANFPYGTAVEATLINQVVQRGWAVAVTDYEGLGTPGDHTYTVGRAEGTAVLDAARAAERLGIPGVDANSPVGIMGYSQGGQASSWAAELHDSYAPDLKVKGTATGGVPADLMKVASSNDGGLGSGLIFMAAAGQDAAFPELNLNSYLNPAGKALVDYFKNNCVAIDTTVGSFKHITDMTVKNPLQQPDWQARLAESKLGTHRPDAPVYLYHGTIDELIPYAVGQQLRTDWCAKGTNVEWHALPLLGHIGGVTVGGIPAANWLADRFAGKSTHPNC